MSRPGQAFAFALALAVLGACGVPDQTSTTTITAVPYDLLRPEPHQTPVPTPSSAMGPSVYFLRDNTLVAVEANPADGTGDPSQVVSAVLAQLSRGPSDQDRAAGLGTALGPDTAIRLAALDGAVARIDIAAGDQVPAPARVPLAVGQVVLSVTSVPGVAAVLMTRDGSPVEIPLPGGALTDQPVTASDYGTLTSLTSRTKTG